MLEVFYGHRVVASDSRQLYGPDRGNIIHPQRLEEFLDVRRDWAAISVSDLVESGSEYVTSDKAYFALTFDDGYLDNLTTLLPILEDRGIPLMLFVTTGFVNGELEPFEYVLFRMFEAHTSLNLPEGVRIQIREPEEKVTQYRRLWKRHARKSVGHRSSFLDSLRDLNPSESDANRGPDRYLMNWEEVKRLDSHPLVTIAAHTRSHPFLTWTRPREALAELSSSKRMLETKLGRTVNEVAYPYGNSDSLVRGAAFRSRFRIGFTTDERPVTVTDLKRQMSIPRFDLVNPGLGVA